MKCSKTHWLPLAFLLVLAAACSATSDSLDRSDMDPSVDPGVDFYSYTNGGWLRENPVPDDEVSWGVFHEVNDRNEEVVLEILEQLARERYHAPGTIEQQLGDFWASGMDVEEIESAGAQPLDVALAVVDTMESIAGLQAMLPHFHAIDVNCVFGIGSLPDLDDSTRTIAIVSQAGMGLPEKDYYVSDEPDRRKLREQYTEHVRAMFELLGERPIEARSHARTVLEIETALARNSFSAVELRDPSNYSNRIPMSEAQALMPDFDWAQYLKGVGLAGLEEINLVGPEYFEGVNRLMNEVTLREWRVYLRWQVVHTYASSLSSEFVEEDFRFFGTTLAGAQELRPRWRRVLGATNQALGEPLGRAYVERSFSPEAKRRCEEMVANLLLAFRERLVGLEWMSDETRAQALHKLDSFGTKIGYPDQWRDYGDLRVVRGNYFQNLVDSARFEFAYQISKVGKPTDPDEWEMPAHMVNAYYHPLHNEIVFPAGILQPPFFSEDYDDALNYGAMGAVIGHEITHGFDDSGSRFDADGNLKNWWTEADREEFERRAAVVREQFDGYVALPAGEYDGEQLPDLHVNGELTLGENIADLGGLTIAYEALQKALPGQPRSKVDGYTPEQRFFLAWARAWRSNIRPESLRLQVNTNTHAPARFRAVGPLSNLDTFAGAFQIDTDAPMLRPASARAEIW